MLTIKLIERGGNGLDACLAAKRHGKCSFEGWNHDRRMYVGMCRWKGSIGGGLSRVMAMLMCAMVGWFVMRAAASQPASLSPGRISHLRPFRRPEVFHEKSAAQPFAIGQPDITPIYHHHHRPPRHHRSTATSARDTTYPQLLHPATLAPSRANDHRRHVAICRTGTPLSNHSTRPEQTSNKSPSRPASPTLAHGTSSTPAPTPALSAAWPPPSP